MQLRLLNIHKFLANISYEMVGAFVPLIIYQLTGNMLYSLIFLFLRYALSILIDSVIKKFMAKNPQIFLMLRVIPIILSSVFVMVLESLFWVGFFGSVICVAFAYSFGTLPNFFSYNYSSVKTDGSAAGMSIVIEKAGVIVAVVSGGLFLDYLSTPVLIVVSFIIYMISCVPLIIYYINSKKNGGLNKESTSNVIVATKENEVRNKAGKLVSKKILAGYAMAYFLVCTTDVFLNIFNLYMYSSTGQFQLNGYFGACLNVAMAIGGILSAKLESKFDLTIPVCATLAIGGGVIMAVPFITNIIAIFAIVFIVGVGMAGYSAYLLNRVLSKTRILGISNRAMFYRNECSTCGYLVVIVSCMFGTLVPGFFVMGLANIISSAFLPLNEERTRKLLIKYLQGGKISKKESSVFKKLKSKMKKKSEKLAEDNNIMVIDAAPEKETKSKK